MTDNSNKILLLGLPESGKTSFLAALVYYIDSDISDKKLSQYKQSSNTTYTTSIVQNWLKGVNQERTKITASTNASTIAELYLEEKETGQKFTMHIPDFYGEIFANQFNDRLLELDYLAQIETADAALLFINPEKIKEPTLIEDIQGALILQDRINDDLVSENKVTDVSANETSNTENLIPQENLEDEIEPFSEEQCPTQLVLVDLLEVNLEYSKSLSLNIAIVISAWDTIKKDMPQLEPMKWIENTLPLLYQYLNSNSERINYKVFGISALGGDLTDSEEVERLTSLSEPAERILVQEEGQTHHNITSPIEWLLRQWQKIAI